MGRPTPEALEELEERIGHSFRDRSLLIDALTHGSAKSPAQQSNERLEFLGDAVLGMIVSEILYRIEPALDEGLMTKAKAQVVSRRSLARVAGDLELSRFVIVGRMFKDREQISRSILANAVEALIAAIHLDAGIDAAREFVTARLGDAAVAAARTPGVNDYKSLLGQWSMQHLGSNPEYRIESREGPDHALVFEVSVRLDGIERARATGRSKKAAEQEAARQVLAEIGENDEESPPESRS